MQVHPLDDLPLYTSKAEAGATLLKAVPKKLINNPRVYQVNRLVEMTRPFEQNMKILKSSFTRESYQYVCFQVYLTLTVINFLVSTMLGLVFMYVYHRYILRDSISPKSSTRNNANKPVLHVPIECSTTVSANLSKRYHFRHSNEDTVAKVNSNLEPQMINPPEATSSSSVASQRFYDNYMLQKTPRPNRKGTMPLLRKKKKPRLSPLKD